MAGKRQIPRRNFLENIAGLAGLAGAGLLPQFLFAQDPKKSTEVDADKPGVYNMRTGKRNDPNTDKKPAFYLELSGKYDSDDFRIALGPAYWNRLSQDRKDLTLKMFSGDTKAPLEYRQTVCVALHDHEAFRKNRLSRQQRTELENWQRARYWLERSNNDKGKKPVVPLFKPGTDMKKIKEEYKQSHPFIFEEDLVELPSDVSITMLVLVNESRNGYSRINPELRKKYKEIPYHP